MLRLRITVLSDKAIASAAAGAQEEVLLLCDLVEGKLRAEPSLLEIHGGPSSLHMAELRLHEEGQADMTGWGL